jgi:hypothetical protein
MDVRLIFERATESANKIATIPDEGMCEDGGEGSERETIGDTLGRREVQWRVCGIFGRIERAIGKNFRGVEYSTGVVES